MKPVVKRTLWAGIIFGVVMGVAVALSMDLLMSGASDGGWYESVKHDVSLFFGPDWAERSWFIHLGVVVVVLAIGGIGGIIGAAFGFIVGKFFSMLNNL